MKTKIKILTIIFIILLIIPLISFFLYSQAIGKDVNDDIIPPKILSVTGNITSLAGQSTTISGTFSDNIEVIYAEIFYRFASSIKWSNKSILTGTTNIFIPSDSLEAIFYYIVINDAAGNGPIGDPSIDGSNYYIINVLNSMNRDNTDQNYTIHAFLELPKPTISCIECPKIAAMIDEIFDSGNYPFYYVTLPEINDKAAARIKEYNVWGYPTIYFDGGYNTIVGSTVDKSTIIEKILSTIDREHTNLSLKVTADCKFNNSEMTLEVLFYNHESQLYSGLLRVYLSEIVSTTDLGNTPTRFSFIDFLMNEKIQVAANDNKSIKKIVDVSELDPENLMIFAVVFNEETHIGYSQPPDKNQFDAHYVDAVDATTVVNDGNLPPEVGIKTPSAKYLYLFGKQVRKTFFGKTILLGRTTLIAYASDDSKIEKIEFYINEKLMKTLTEEPYEWLWHQLAIGKRTITVKAYDDQGKTTSATIDVLVFMKWPGFFSKFSRLF